MIRIKALLLAICLSLFSLVGLNNWFNHSFHVEDNSIRYGRQVEKNQSRDILTENMDAKTLAVFGSSELVETFKQAFDPSHVFNYRDFHLMQIGRGNFRNIIHAAIMGSIGDALPQQKAVLMQSFQWFTPEGIPSEAFLSRISPEHVYYAMANPKITTEHKRALINRMIELSATNAGMQETFKRYKKVFLDEPDNLIEGQIALIQQQIEVFKNKVKYAIASKDELPLDGETTPSYDWEQGYQTIADTDKAVEKTSNNDFQAENNFYDTMIRPDYDKLKGSDVNGYSDDSPEFKDLGILLDITKDLGIDLRVVIQPVMGKWYDYMGMTAEKRQAYYHRLRTFLEERGVQYFDYSAYDYEPYFMYDMWHPGWKGWTRYEKDLYEFGKQN